MPIGKLEISGRFEIFQLPDWHHKGSGKADSGLLRGISEALKALTRPVGF